MNTSEKSSLFLYSVLISAIAPLFFMVLLFRCVQRKTGYARKMWQKWSIAIPKTKSGGILFHCVSMGEVAVAADLVRKIQKNHPDLPITISTTTETGANQVKNLFKGSVTHLFLPFDIPFLIKRLLDNIAPSKVIITEVEIWPNLVHQCHDRGITSYLINGRMTDKSAKSYGKVSRLIAPTLQKFTVICAQSQRDYNNYLNLGVAKENLILTNNMKFDLSLTEEDIDKTHSLQETLKLRDRKVLMAASTHEPEEELLLDTYLKLKNSFPNLLLLLVPRHPQRFDTAYEICLNHKLKVQKMSDKLVAVINDTDVLFADKMGIMKSLYGLADIAFVGGSVANKGGHNAIEAALQSVPVIMGPHTYNNPLICSTLEQAGALKIAEQEHKLLDFAKDWCENPEAAKEAGKSGAQVLKDNGGAIEATYHAIGL